MLNMLEKDETSLSGFRNRLIGYIGEQKVSDLLDQTKPMKSVWASTIQSRSLGLKN